MLCEFGACSVKSKAWKPPRPNWKRESMFAFCCSRSELKKTCFLRWRSVARDAHSLASWDFSMKEKLLSVFHSLFDQWDQTP